MRRKRTGYTLVSAVVALLVIAVAMTLSVEGLVSLISASRLIEQRLVAAEALDGYLELLRCGARPMPSTGPLDIAQVPGLSVLPQARCSVRVSDSDAPELVEIVVTASWRVGPRRSRLRPHVSLFAVLPARRGEKP
jgi:Type II secretory pathway, pseudopilin PulG